MASMHPAPTYVRPSLLPSKKPPPPPRVELFHVDLATWDDGLWDIPAYTEEQPDELDEPWPYRFKNGESVWVCTSDGDWCRGKIVGQPKRGKLTKSTSDEEGLYWCGEYFVAKSKVRKWLAPLNGEIKPNTKHTLELLVDAGWCDSDNDQ